MQTCASLNASQSLAPSSEFDSIFMPSPPAFFETS
jgi:hypothetical protein